MKMSSDIGSDIRKVVSDASRILGSHDLGDLIWGHASARDPRGRGVWIKAAGLGMEEVTPADVHLVSWNGDVLEGAEAPRHSEYPIHTEIMAARPDVGGVVHTHSPYAVALAAAGVDLLPINHAATMFVPPAVPRFALTGDLILTPSLGSALADTLGGHRAAFLVNHGVVTVGRDVQEATIAAVILERAARQQLLALQYGNDLTWSSDRESLEKRSHIYSTGAMADVWEYLVRKLQSGHPPTSRSRDEAT
jgi:L-ribulose-5-phosphate 4-epimerase